MLDLDTINNTIEELEKSDEITFDICKKLASLYIIRDNLHRSRNRNKSKNDKND